LLLMCLCPCHCPSHCDAILLDEDDIFEFRNIPYNSWIPSSALAFSAITLGAVLIHLTSAKLWFVSLVLWILAGVMLAKVKYERYTFDKIAGTVLITRRGITGTRIKTYSLSNIKEIIYEKERDLQGGDDVQLFMKLENGKEVKLLAGHFCGIRAKLKKLLKKKLDNFLQDVPKLSLIQIHKEKKKEVKIRSDPSSNESSVVSSSVSSDDEHSFSTSESSERSHRIRRRDPHTLQRSDSSSGEKKKRRRKKRSRSRSDTQKGGKVVHNEEDLTRDPVIKEGEGTDAGRTGKKDEEVVSLGGEEF